MTQGIVILQPRHSGEFSFRSIAIGFSAESENPKSNRRNEQQAMKYENQEVVVNVFQACAGNSSLSSGCQTGHTDGHSYRRIGF